MDRFENWSSERAVNAYRQAAQKYSQAPWRTQLQMLVLFALILVCVALVAGIFLNLSARTVTAGRRIQAMQYDMTQLEREIEEYQTRLAFLSSVSQMSKRAREQGYKPISPEQIVYLNVPGYVARQPVILANPTDRSLPSAFVMPERYSETLLEWFERVAFVKLLALKDVQP